VQEIRAWLTLSKLFYRAFQIQRHLGPEWFVINCLLVPSDETLSTSDADNSIVFRDMLKALPAAFLKRSSKNHELSVCLSHLRDLRHIDLLEPENPRGTKRKSLPVATRITVRPKLSTAAHRYVRSVLREWYGPEFSASFSARHLEIIVLLYEFGKTTFLEAWAKLLNSLVKTSPTSSRAREAFVNSMIGSTEYFVLLFSLWEMSLVGDDDEGYRMDMLLALHLFTRHIEDTTLQDCADRLIKHKILEEIPHDDEQTHYRLAQLHLPAFEVFGEKLITFREAVRVQIENLPGRASA